MSGWGCEMGTLQHPSTLPTSKPRSTHPNSSILATTHIGAPHQRSLLPCRHVLPVTHTSELQHAAPTCGYQDPPRYNVTSVRPFTNQHWRTGQDPPRPFQAPTPRTHVLVPGKASAPLPLLPATAPLCVTANSHFQPPHPALTCWYQVIRAPHRHGWMRWGARERRTRKRLAPGSSTTRPAAQVLMQRRRRGAGRQGPQATMRCGLGVAALQAGGRM